jgi:LemA protein
MIWGVIIGGVVLAVVVVGYNGLARMRNIVRNAWSDIDVQLRRRADLVPNLVETTKGYSGFERETLESVTRARTEAESGALSPSKRAEKEDALASRILTVLAVVEDYPELKASAQFLRLQEELSETETKIASARQYYNAAVRDYNTMIESFPSSLIAGLFVFRKSEFFSVDSEAERIAPSARMDG